MSSAELLWTASWVVAGLAIILVGPRFLIDGLEKSAGTPFAALLASATATPGRAFLVGTLAAASLQSSSAVTLTTVALVQAGAMKLGAAVGVVLGANVGTTVTAQMMAFSIGRYWMIPVALGAAAEFLWRKPWGRALTGMGLCFFGLVLLEEGAAPLAATPLMQKALHEAENPLRGVLLGAFLTALAQSSTAITALLIAFARNGLVTLPAAIAVNLGANVGTCATSLIAGSKLGRAGMQVAVTHFAFNLAGAITALPFVYPFAAVMAALSVDPARQVANAHALFNLVTALAALPLANWWADLLASRGRK